MSRVLAEDCNYTLTDLGTDANPTNNPITITLFARSVKGGDKLNKVSVKGIGEKHRRQRGTFGESDYTIEMLRETTVPVNIPIGNNVNLSVPEAGINFTGLLDGNDSNLADSEALLVTLTVTDGDL